MSISIPIFGLLFLGVTLLELNRMYYEIQVRKIKRKRDLQLLAWMEQQEAINLEVYNWINSKKDQLL